MAGADLSSQQGYALAMLREVDGAIKDLAPVLLELEEHARRRKGWGVPWLGVGQTRMFRRLVALYRSVEHEAEVLADAHLTLARLVFRLRVRDDGQGARRQEFADWYDAYREAEAVPILRVSHRTVEDVPVDGLPPWYEL